MNIQSVSPDANQKDVVLGQPIEVIFDHPVDPASVSSQTFSLTGPGQTSLVDAQSLIRKNSFSTTGREYVEGAFSFPAPAGDSWAQNQKLVFTPSRPLRPDVVYTVLILGQGSVLSKSFIKDADGAALDASYQYTFTTGSLNLKTPPLKSPLPFQQPWERPKLAPTDILVRPRRSTGNDLTQEIEILFPGPIDPASFNLNDIIVAGEPFLNDPETQIPSSSASIAIDGNKLRITVHWGADPTQVPQVNPYPPPGASGPAPDSTDYGWTEPENDPFIRVS